MFKGKRIIGVIPARSGSRRLPGKNARDLCGKPLTVHAIEQAKKSRYLDEVLVSTDSRFIARMSKRHGACVPFLRPRKLATDSAKTIDVIDHALGRVFQEGAKYDVVVLLQPTSPLRLPSDIDNAIRELFLKNARAVVSVCETEHHPYWTNTLPKDRCMKDFVRLESENKNKQELPSLYRLNGAVYVAYTDYLRKRRGWFGDHTYAYVMPRERSVDIDDKLDWKLAELLMKRGGSIR
ncbi:MAG: acylneuraminate cytidylyltransferase family protein [Candidatus Omnitrophica bacterium]|nr:acylneuraminate cytidylyltransferase family protein [Candidatus Omnitrophota bacterium]